MDEAPERNTFTGDYKNKLHIVLHASGFLKNKSSEPLYRIFPNAPEDEKFNIESALINSNLFSVVKNKLEINYFELKAEHKNSQDLVLEIDPTNHNVTTTPSMKDRKISSYTSSLLNKIIYPTIVGLIVLFIGYKLGCSPQ